MTKRDERRAADLEESRARLKAQAKVWDAEWAICLKEHPLTKIVPKCPLMKMIVERKVNKVKELSWNQYFMGIAEAVSKKSHCLSHQFGAIAVDADQCIVSTGYNGPPRGYPHCGLATLTPVSPTIQTLTINLSNTAICPRRLGGFQSGEGLEFCPAAHAERNVLINAARHGASLKGCTLYVTSMTPCRECAKEIVNAGIKEVFYMDDSIYPELGISGRDILEKCGVKLTHASW